MRSGAGVRRPRHPGTISLGSRPRPRDPPASGGGAGRWRTSCSAANLTARPGFEPARERRRSPVTHTMPNEPELRPVASPSLRERTIADLCRHFAEDRLTIEEFERRVEIAHTARTEVELKDLVRDLPELAASQPRPAPAATGSLAPASGSARPAPIVAIMSGAERKGGWTPARRTVVTAIMGGVELDFREARLGPGVTELTVVSIMGGVVITVPPDLQVDAEGVPIMGGFQHMHPTVE